MPLKDLTLANRTWPNQQPAA